MKIFMRYRYSLDRLKISKNILGKAFFVVFAKIGFVCQKKKKNTKMAPLIGEYFISRNRSYGALKKERIFS